MPVMWTQVLMRAAALVVTPQGDKPTTWNRGMQTEKDAALEKQNWSKRQRQQNCKIYTKYLPVLKESATQYMLLFMCHVLCVTLFFYASQVNKCSTENLLTWNLSCMFLTRRTGGYENKLGGTVVAQSSVFLGRMDHFAICWGMWKRDAAKIP